ncbi:carboxypeptidase regulatory-like domain-containing protein [Peribacillus glennii]|uniref:SbsA Ig-like domain-containing protein n=1 Tax=Peribacillus glennii TaxID=2303991 RepID=A0A372L885_9BACI|nr:carboxypeptidase regulatory-like domain-containing protein [Peribacillus glennii]RFU61097.1 hypothetical protein D0466_19120 [Peribacillus glennii]
MQKRKYFHIFMAFFLLLSLISAPLMAHAEETSYKTLPSKKNVPLDKEWTISFNNELEPASINEQNVFVLDSSGNIVSTSAYVHDNDKQVLVRPPSEGYKANTSYTLFVESDVYSKKNKLIKKPVKMSFKTGTTKADPAKTFTPRNDSANDVVLSSKIADVDSKVFEDAKDINLEGNSIVYPGKNDELLALKPGEIIVLPATETYPGGYAKKIVKASFDGTNTIITTSEPKMEEVVKDMDVSKQFDIDITDNGINPDAFPVELRRVSKTSNKIVYASREDTSDKITVGRKNDYQYIEYKDFPVLKDDDGDDIATLNGMLKIYDPNVTLDFSFWRQKFNYAEYSSRYDNKLTVTLGSDVEFKKKFDPTLAVLPVKFMGALGAELKLQAIFSAEGKITSEIGLDTELNVRMGVKNVDGRYKTFDESKFKNSPKVTALKGTLEGKGALRTELAVDLFQWEPAAVYAEGGLKAKLEGESSTDSILCFKGDLSFYTQLGLEITLPFYKEEFSYSPWKKSLLKGSTCQLEDLVVNPGKVVLKPGESIRIGVKGIDASFREKEFSLPDTGISLKSKDKNVAKVNTFGDITASVNAEDGDETEVEVTYSSDMSRSITKKVKVQIATDSQFKITASGKVIDMITKDPIADAKVSIHDQSNRAIAETKTNDSGEYSVKIPQGKYKFKVSAVNFRDAVSNIEVPEDMTDSVLPIKPVLMVSENAEVGTVKGKIVNAVNGEIVEDATISLRFGDNQEEGDIFTTVTTDSQGLYEAAIPAGTYTGEISKEGFVTNFTTIVSEANTVTENQNATITPLLNSGDMRIVLTWGTTLEDIDSHLFGPAENGAFHLFYRLVGDSEYEVYSGAKLDIDDRSYEGPETVTITEPRQGVYRYIVHDYTNMGSTDSFALSESDAKVEIFMGNSDVPVRVFRVPANKPGTLWRVFDFNTNTGKITSINDIIYETPQDVN